MAKLQDLSKGQRNFLLTAATVVLCVALVGAAEIAVRVRQHMQSGTAGGIEKTYTTDAKSGLRVPVAGLVQGGVRINSLGFRGPEIESPKPSNTVRVAFLGASTTYSAEVSSNEATWAHLVVEQLRAAHPGTRFDYVNAAVPGYTVDTSVKNLSERVAVHNPDVIVIYHATNDLSFNSKVLAEAAGLVTEGGERALSWPSKYSTLWYLVEKNLQIKARQRQATSDTAKLEIDTQALSEPFRKDLAMLVDTSAKVAKLVVLVTFSHQQRAEQAPAGQAEAAVTSLYYMPYMSLGGLLAGFSAYNDVIRETAAQYDMLLVADEHSVPGDAAHFNDSVHFTDAGSKAMAQRVASVLTSSTRFSTLVSSISKLTE